MNFEEITDTIKGKLYERIGNTFLFSYSILFLSINWKYFYQIYNAYSLIKINDYLEKNPINLITPLYFAILYTLFMPVIILISESYQELVKIGTIQIRNYMRKKWQEVELTTISSIEEKYKNKILALETKIRNNEIQFELISKNLVDWFKKNYNIDDSVTIIFHKTSENLKVGDVAVNVDGIASRFISSNYPVLGIVVDKPTETYSFIIKDGELNPEICDISQFQNIILDGIYILSNKFPSRLDYLDNERRGTLQQIGKKEGSKFTVELKNIQRN
ncbi:hypothetical protein LPTSP4_36800 [Leptospira ryugenii]|uniref:Uncharacterized protein n=1 Tax=Leptospira ryugenii TaxID=1917863 RepID=A0A2P2E5K4_9LEPT|nr:hypothetical protein [Leptospira ryugenii]GBF52142.1 hypothetical protein LPTSP4_36800 [Leptospira ryugenii]